MKHLTKIFVIIAIALFVVGYYLQATGHESSGIKLLIAAIMFMFVRLSTAIIIDEKRKMTKRSNSDYKDYIYEKTRICFLSEYSLLILYMNLENNI